MYYYYPVGLARSTFGKLEIREGCCVLSLKKSLLTYIFYIYYRIYIHVDLYIYIYIYILLVL